MIENARQYAPAAARNRDPIWNVLRPLLPPKGIVLEIASGTGEHVTHFAQLAGPLIQFQPSDPSPSARASIDAWTAASQLPNVRPAVALDAAAEVWPVAHADAVVCINMIHISPWRSTLGLISGAASLLPAGGVLFLYGPYRRGGAHTAPSNEAFDADLRRRNAEWGVRDLEAVAELATAAGFGPPHVEPMPANNLSVVFSRLR
ncbi:MAG: DUF938 domain-containing protein [Hyphomicrobium sp.]|jgi:SAM-dependent methyltransferase